MTVTSAKCITLLLVSVTQFWATTTILQPAWAAPNPPRATVLVPDWSQYSHIEPEGVGTYSFGYDIEDPETNNIQYRSEARHANGTVTGSYGYLEPNGNIHMVHYVADQQGYRATVEDSSRSGMLKPIPVLQDINYIAYGYSPEMLAALKSQQIYKKQKVHEQRERPIDQQSQTRQELFPTNDDGNEKLKQKIVGQNKQPFTNTLPTVYPGFNNYAHLLGNGEKIEDNLDFLPFA